MSGEQDDDFFDDAFGTPCPHCNGDGEVNCHCGGDLCICDNHGDAPCPVCIGEGEVSEAAYEKYEKGRRQHAEALRTALDAAQAMGTIASEAERLDLE